MRLFHFLFLFLFFVFLSFKPAFAENIRVEALAINILDSLKKDQFTEVEEIFAEHIQNNTITRHGSDSTLEIFDILLEKINEEAKFDYWYKKQAAWEKQSPDNFLPDFFLHRLTREEAWHYKDSDEWHKLLQSARRRYVKSLNNSYRDLLKLVEKYPAEWRLHAYLARNFKDYQLTKKELETHFKETQKKNSYEVLSLSGYIESLSPYSLGRDDEIIAKGIANILTKYPERNLSKPEYIDEATKQEIEDQIFELIIGRVLLTARKYADEAPETSAAPALVPLAYKVIYYDLKKYYEDNPERLKTHPLSLERQAVWNEIQQSYHKLSKRYPNSAKHLTDQLELALEFKSLTTIADAIANIETNAPEYNPARISPIQCTYYSTIEEGTDKPDILDKMYSTCKKAAKYREEEVYLYRAGWAARQIGNFEESTNFIERALKFAPQNEVYLTDVCWNHKDLKRFDKALDFCERAITADRKYARAWLGRSHIYYYGFKDTARAQKDAEMYERLTKGK